MSIPEVLESMDRAGADNRRAADEEAEVLAALRAEAARAGSQRALAEEWGMSAQFLGKVINGQRRSSATILDKLGVPRLGAARNASRKLDKLHVARRPAARPARRPREWRYPLRPLVLHIFAIEEEMRRWAIESAPGQIREREAAMAGGSSSGN